MDVKLGFLEILSLGAQLASHKILQNRLATNEFHEVTTNYGKVKGVKRRVVYENDEDYYAFEGIPYAKPPLGDLRFRPPQPPESWKHVLDCTTTRGKPVQKNPFLGYTEGSEDCLYLNVYTKKIQSEKPLPVMVYIYGGGYRYGEATRDFYAPDYFMKQNIVLVTLNYRLGALGFLSLEDPDLDVPGNAGLKDQLYALRWIKANIQYFNGDPNNITLFGESAGAASTQFMMITPKAKGLFHKAILQSGSVFNPWATTDSRKWGYRIAVKLGYKGSENDKEVFRFLAKADATKLVGIDLQVITRSEKVDGIIFTFLPVVEPYESTDCIISKPYKDMLKSAWGNDIPIIIGATSFEGLYFYQYAQQEKYLINELGDCESLLPNDVKPHHNSNELKEMGLTLKETYFKGKEPNISDSFYSYLDLMSYKMFWHGIHRTVLSRLNYAAQTPTYLYRFDFDSKFFNHYRILNCGPNVRGVSHGDDVSYLFYLIKATKLSKTSKEYKTIERMIALWTSFAATSNPNCQQIAPIVWEPVQNSNNIITSTCPVNIKCLNIGEEVDFITLPEMNKLQVWDKFYTKEPL